MGILEDIFEPIQDDLDKFSDIFAELLKSRVRVINIIARHMARQRGKRVRPALVLLSAHLCGEPDERTYRSAALIEMLHNATLIHDDVVDDSYMRRGGPTINAIWKNKVSVLMGDYFLARSLIAAADMKDPRIIDILSEASARMSQGEIDQMIRSRRKDIDEESYYKIIGDKTAALISASCQLGVISVGAPPEKLAVLKEFGEKIGLAFQIKDDMLDFQGEEKLFGKKKGTDLRDGKITLPLIHALKQIGRNGQQNILKLVKKKATGEDIRTVIRFVYQNKGLAYSAEKARQLIEEACGLLDDFPDSRHKNSIVALSRYFVNRQK